MTPEEILIKAAEDQVKHGHHKEHFYATGDPDQADTSPACSYGSLARVAGVMRLGGPLQIHCDIDDGGVSRAAEMLARQIRLEHPKFLTSTDYNTITNFNDDDHTTGEDVALMMKKAAHHG